MVQVLEASNTNITHFDQFTRDKTPANPRFGPIVSSLPPSIEIRDEEFPLDFCHDLEAIIQGLVGMMFATFDQHAAAISALDQALERAGNSTNHQIDSLRAKRALSLSNLGHTDNAISDLRERVQLPDPSPHLLRSLAHILSERYWTNPDPEADKNEAITQLRAALHSKNDPERDTTAYNLVTLLPHNDPESNALIGSLLSKRSSYRRFWYVRKLPADHAWAAYQVAVESGDREAAKHHAREAAKWYSRMLRARPRIQFMGLRPRWPFIAVKTIQRSPILYANTKDGHSAAGHQVRARYFEWRFQRIRNRMLTLGDRSLRKSEWNMAYAYFDWASCVGRRDGTEHRAAAFAACCCWKGGRKKDGLAKWNQLAQKHPDCLLGRALMSAQLHDLGLDPTLPGDEPTEIEKVMELIGARFLGWAWHTDGEFISPAEFAKLEGEPDS